MKIALNILKSLLPDMGTGKLSVTCQEECCLAGYLRIKQHSNLEVPPVINLCKLEAEFLQCSHNQIRTERKDGYQDQQ